MSVPTLALVEFTALDWFWVVAFVLVIIVCGVVFYKLGKRSEAQFFLAGRGLPWLAAGDFDLRHAHADVGYRRDIGVRPARSVV